jgi:hypothetical protein
MRNMVVTWMNRDRVAKGLTPYVTYTALQNLAMDRAARMASKNTLSHAAAGGNVGSALSARGIQWYSFGEIIGVSSYPWGSQAASNIYSMWKHSTFHAGIMFSKTYNYLGVGVAYRSSNHTTWMSVVFTESVDHTRPAARLASVDASRQDVSVSWSGRDVKLQTHTAGLRSFDVQERVDGGSWKTIRNDTTSTSLTLADRPRGHWYGFRVQAADRRGNLSSWTSELRVWVP